MRPHVELFRLEDTQAPKAIEVTQIGTTSVQRITPEATDFLSGSTSDRSEMVRCDYSKSALRGEIQVVVAKEGEDTTEYTVIQTNEDDEEPDESDEEPQPKQIYMETIDEENLFTDNSERYHHQPDKRIEILETRQYSEDSDEKFLFSCLPVFKRLPPRKNALLKLKIQTLLYEIEFGDDEPPEKRKK